VGISLRDGGNYYSKRARGWVDGWGGSNYGGRAQGRGMLSIEDPADPTNDISKGSYAFPRVRSTFAGAHGILTSTVYLRAGVLNSRRNRGSFRLRDHYEPEDLGILTSILGVTQETLSHRKLVQELYDSRILHKMLGVDTEVRRAPQVVNGVSNGVNDDRKYSREAQNAVHSAWTSEDRQLSDDDEGGRRAEDGEEVEEGRYDIPPPKKRRKTGRSDKHEHTVVYVSGSEDEREDEAYRAVTIEVEREQDGERKSERRDTASKRSYWLSKGIGLGGDEDE